jgi:hypothetical protein
VKTNPRTLKTFKFQTNEKDNHPLQLYATLKAENETEATKKLVEILPELIEVHKTLNQKTLEKLGVQEITIKIKKSEIHTDNTDLKTVP